MQLMSVLLWADFKTLVAAKGLRIQYSSRDNLYDIYASETGTFLWSITLVIGTDDAVDFEDNYKSAANKPLEYRSEDGLLKVANAKFADVLSYHVVGLTPLVIESATTGYIRYAVPFVYTLSGTHVMWEDANWGDSIDFEVGVYFDLEDEESFMSFNSFGDKFNVYKTGNLLIDVPTVRTLPVTVNFGYGAMQVYVRVKYSNVGASASRLLINLIGWR